MTIALHHGDCREIIPTLGVTVDLAFYEGGGTHSVQAKGRNRTVDHGPLFAGAAE